MPSTDNIQTVRAWHDAVNDGDVARVLRYVAPNIVFVGPRGEMTGAQVIEDWVKRSGIQIVPVAWYARGDQVVVEQESAWTDMTTGFLTEPQIVATAFTVVDGRVTRLARYDTAGEALAAAGLTATDAQDIEGAPAP